MLFYKETSLGGSSVLWCVVKEGPSKLISIKITISQFRQIMAKSFCFVNVFVQVALTPMEDPSLTPSGN